VGARGTYKPCPVCGEEGHRDVGMPCGGCLNLMEDGRKYRKSIEREMKKKENLVVVCPTNWCAPRTYLKGLYQLYQRDLGGEIIGKCLRDLALKLSTESNLYPSKNPKFHLYKKRHKKGDHNINDPFNWREARIMDKRVAGLLHRLFFAIDRTMELVRNEAVAYGKNILIQLTEGKITLDEFDASK